MKRVTSILLLGLFLTSITLYGQEAITDYKMTLDECLEYAMENNENVIIANLEIQSAKAKTGEYLSTGFPQVDGLVSFNKNFILRKAFLPASFMNPNAPEGEFVEIAFGTPYTGDMGLNLSQMIFNGSYFVGIKASKTYQELSRKDHINSQIDVTEAVTKAYYSVLVNQMMLESINSNFGRIDSLVRETSLMYENGFAELLDLNRTQVEFNNIKTQKANSERAVEISKGLLKYQMGMPVTNNLEISEKMADLDLNVEGDLKMTYNYQRRIDYSLLQTQMQLTEMEMKNNKAQYLPSLDFNFSWGMNAGVSNASSLTELSNRMVWPEYQLAGLNLKLPIFDGLLKAKKIQQNKIKMEQQGFQRKMLENAIQMQVNQMRKSLENNMSQLKNQEENTKLAESVYNQTKIKYQEGVGTNLEVIEADNSFKQAQTNYFNALYDALIAYVDYQKALGILKID